jgi:hypothetical protein
MQKRSSDLGEQFPRDAAERIAGPYVSTDQASSRLHEESTVATAIQGIVTKQNLMRFL